MILKDPMKTKKQFANSHLLHILIFVLITCFGTGITNAQSRADVKLDTTEIVTGQQISLLLEYHYPKGAKIDWPVKTDTITRAIEVIRKLKADTSVSDKGLISIRQRYIITSFDSGHQVIPPMQFGYMFAGDSVAIYTESEPLLLSVITPEVDTAQGFKAIKGPLKAPVSIWEILPWILRIWGIIGIILLIFVIVYYFKKGRLPLIKPKEEIRLPADEEALQAFENLRLKKLWQNGQFKLYFSEMTDIIRVYIERRFDVMAIEMTTEEIIENLAPLNINREVKNKLHEALQLADLVKFAKAEPMPLECDLSIQHCMDFVKETAQKPEEISETNQEEKPDKKSNQ